MRSRTPCHGRRTTTALELGVRCFAWLLAALLPSGPAWSITFGQIDDFQDATTQGWGSGALNPNPPVTIADAGPAGVGDYALQITSAGAVGPGSRLVAFNTTQWAGDYPTEGVDLIVADVSNVGATALNLRLAIDGAGGRFASTVSVPLAPASGWQTIGLPITGADLSSAGGLDVNATLGAVTELRLLSAAAPAFAGDPIVAQLWVDNVVALPEPAQPALLAAGLACLWTLGRWRARARPA